MLGTHTCAHGHSKPSREGLGDYVRTIGRLATRVTLCLGFLVCLTVVGASGAGAQTATTSCSGGSGGSGSGPGGCTTLPTVSTVPGNTPTTVSGLAFTGEQAAIPLVAAGGLIVLVLAARQLRRRSNS